MPGVVASATAPIRGDYVEARTASVFAGACHYNGERVTEGRGAVLACNITAGNHNGIDLAGVRIAAAVAADENLAEASATRRSEIVIDADSDARADAALAWLRQRAADQLGTVVAVRRQPITFARSADTFTVRTEKLASLTVRALPDRACCSQPELVWYQPLISVTDRRVGYTESARSDPASLSATWQRSDENSAIYGTLDR